MSICDTCAYLEYDEETQGYECSVDLDEDDMVRYYESGGKVCSYYRNGDEYAVVRHQS